MKKIDEKSREGVTALDDDTLDGVTELDDDTLEGVAGGFLILAANQSSSDDKKLKRSSRGRGRRES